MKPKKLYYDEFNKEVISLVKEVAAIYKVGSEIKNITFQDFLIIKC